MPKRELNIFYFPNVQTPPGYDHYHSENDQQTLSPPPRVLAPGLSPFPTSHILFHCSCSLCLSSALLTIISDSFHELLVCLPFPSTSSFPLPLPYRSLPSFPYSFILCTVCSLGNWQIKLHFGFKIHEGLLKLNSTLVTECFK